MFRGLGQAPTDAELKEWSTELRDKLGGSEMMGFSEFVELFVVKRREIDTEDDIEKAFLVFNRVGDDSIQLAELEQILTQTGEPLSAHEMKLLVAQAVDEDGDNQVNYERLIKKMMSSYHKN